jgi:predicted metal-binding membrane protein
MATIERRSPVGPVIVVGAAAPTARGLVSLVVPALILAAWAILLVADETRVAGALHHHALIEGGVPLIVAIPAFLTGWVVMVAAMMLPASLPTIRAVDGAIARLPRQHRARVAFLASFALVWVAFGLGAFVGEIGVHHVVDMTPWLAARPWLVEAGILALAGVYQFVPLKRRSLAACRHPVTPAVARSVVVAETSRLGFRHGLACLGSSWALMLLMFGEGFGGLGWMIALTGLMLYEATGRRGQRVASLAGVVLILAAVAVLSGDSNPFG